MLSTNEQRKIGGAVERSDVYFDFMVQVQTDPVRMPIPVARRFFPGLSIAKDWMDPLIGQPTEFEISDFF
jgi:hypothetical protein